MGTRGIIGFRINDTDKLIYNHFDSYPEGLGKDTIGFLNTALINPQALKEAVTNLVMIKDKHPEPTKEQILKLKQYADTGVSTGKLTEWYVLLRKTQGDIAKILEAGYAESAHNFIYDSLFCEYAYIINLDTNELECYKGFQRSQPTLSRYKRKAKSDAEYWGCELVITVTFGVANWL